MPKITTKDLKIEYIEINKLKPNEYNPKQMTQKQHDDLVESIENFGMVDPVIANKGKGRENILIGGHQRWQIHKELGIKKIPAVFVNIPDLENEMELNLRLTKNEGEIDWDKLANISEDILIRSGFEDQDIEKMMSTAFGSEDKAPDDKAPPLPDEAKAKLGDLYYLGNHRLLCGDSTKESDMERLMDGAEADIVFTDPPYNVNYKGTKFDGIMNDNMEEDKFVEFTISFMTRMMENLKTGGVFYICSGYSSYPIFLYAIKATEMIFQNPIIWVKNNTNMGWNDYRYKHEMVLAGKKPKRQGKKAVPILYGWNRGKHYFIETRFESDVWEIKRKAGSNMIHPTQKPLALVNRALTNSSKANENVLDQFGGSGSTLIGAEMTRRNAYIMELDPKFVDVILSRWENFTGQAAIKEQQ